MSTITKLSIQKNKRRVNLYLDNRFGFGLDLEETIKLGLKVGKELEPASISQLIKTDQLIKLYQKTLNFLSYRPRSQKEIKDHLNKNLYKLQLIEATSKQEIIDKILAKLLKQKLIDDVKFANWWVEQRLSFRPKSSRFLRLELRQKGIEQVIIDQVLANINQSKQEELALSIVNKKMNNLKNLPLIKIKQKLFNLLLSRGFDYSLAKKVIDENSKK